MPIQPVGPVLHGIPIPWSPVIAPGVGAWTSASVQGSRAVRMSKWVYIWALISIVSNGTGASTVRITTPGTYKLGVILGRELNVTGSLLQAVISGPDLVILNFDNSYPGGDNRLLAISGMLEV